MHWDWIQIQAVMRIRMNYYTDLDPDPESGNFSYRSKSGSGSTNLDPHVINFWKKFFLKLRKKKFPLKKIFPKNNKKILAPEYFYIFLVSWVSEWWIFVFNLTLLPLIYLILTCVDPDCSRDTDPDPQSSWIRIQCGSRSITLIFSYYLGKPICQNFSLL